MTKFIITGKHSSGKHEVSRLLEERGVRVGHTFSNFDSIPKRAYIDPEFEHYTREDIDRIFEQKSYIYLSGIEETGIEESNTFYKGLSYYTFDRSDVVVIPYTQIPSLNRSILADEDIVIVWLDGKLERRISRHAAERRTYSFNELEEIEGPGDSAFIKNIYNLSNDRVLYFADEVPERVATILQTLISHPDLLSLYVENFN